MHPLATPSLQQESAPKLTTSPSTSWTWKKAALTSFPPAIITATSSCARSIHLTVDMSNTKIKLSPLQMEYSWIWTAHKWITYSLPMSLLPRKSNIISISPLLMPSVEWKSFLWPWLLIKAIFSLTITWTFLWIRSKPNTLHKKWTEPLHGQTLTLTSKLPCVKWSSKTTIFFTVDSGTTLSTTTSQKCQTTSKSNTSQQINSTTSDRHIWLIQSLKDATSINLLTFWLMNQEVSEPQTFN